MILVDGSHCLYRTLLMNKDQVNSEPSFIAHLFINQILSFSSKLGGSKLNRVVVCFDSSSWRKKYYVDNRPKDYGNETYKGNRVKDESIDWDSIFSYVNQVADTLDKYSDFETIRVDEAEADDIIAVLTKEYRDKEPIWIASSDKDFVQLQDTPNVNIYDPLKQKFKPTVDKDFFLKTHIIMGDSSDNIKAIRPGVGEKTAVKLLKELDILLQTNPSMKEKYIFNQNLIDFEFIPCYISERIKEQFNQPQGKFNAMELMKAFRTLKLVQHTENINKFKLSDQPVVTKLNSYFKNLEHDKKIASATLDDFFS